MQKIANKLMAEVTKEISLLKAEFDEIKQQMECDRSRMDTMLNQLQERQKQLEETTSNLKFSLSFTLKKHEQDIVALRNSLEERYNKQHQSLCQRTTALNKQIEDVKFKMMKRIEDTKEDITNNMTLMKAEINPAKCLPATLNKLQGLYTEVYEWSIKSDDWKSSTSGRECISKVFSLHGYTLNTQIQLEHRKNGMVYLYYQWKQSQKLKHPVNIKEGPKLAVVLKDLSHWEFKHDVIRYIDYSFSFPKEWDRYIGAFALLKYNKLFSSPYVKDNRIQIKVFVEPLSTSEEYFSNNGVLVWLVDNFKQRKQMEIDEQMECQTSPYFYTSSQGYKLNVCLFLCGFKGSRDISVCVCHCTGKYDDMLENLFPHKMTVTLFHQKNPKNNITVMSIKHVLDRNTVAICSQSELLEKGFLQNNSLLLKFVIEPL
ncbi:hypothetical protein CHUAL_002197 [Chamberlinius hualienensis]